MKALKKGLVEAHRVTQSSAAKKLAKKLAGNKLDAGNAIIAKRQFTGFESKAVFAQPFKRAPKTDAELQKFVHTTLSRKWHLWVADAQATNVKLDKPTDKGARTWSSQFGALTFSGDFDSASNTVHVRKTNFPDRTPVEPAKPQPPFSFHFHQTPTSTEEMRAFVHTALGRNFVGVADNMSTAVKLGSEVRGARSWVAQYNALLFSGKLIVDGGEVIIQTAGRVK